MAEQDRGRAAYQLALFNPADRFDKVVLEVQIVAKKHRSGRYTFEARQLTLQPFAIRTYKLGGFDLVEGFRHSPFSAAVRAAGLFAVDEECGAALD